MKLPKNFESFTEARREGFLKVKKLKDNGENVVGIFCTYTPKELIYAAGAHPVSLCSSSDETIPDAEKNLPKNLCPLIKASYGFALTDKCPYVYFSDLIVGETTCDGKKKMYELLGELKPTYILNLPNSQNDVSLQLWREELNRFKDILEEKFGKKIGEEELRKAIKECNKERAILKELYSLGKLVPPPISGYNMYKILDGANYSFDKKEQNRKILEIIEDLKNRYENGERVISEKAPRILITGCPMGGVVEKIVKTIEELGGVVVCYESCTGIKNLEEMIDETMEPLDAIAKKYLNIPCSVMTPNFGRERLLRKLIKEYKVDGVIEVILQACHTYAIESHSIRRVMEDENIPYLALETDYSKSDFGQVKIRLEAFLEVIS